LEIGGIQLLQERKKMQKLCAFTVENILLSSQKCDSYKNVSFEMGIKPFLCFKLLLSMVGTIFEWRYMYFFIFELSN